METTWKTVLIATFMLFLSSCGEKKEEVPVVLSADLPSDLFSKVEAKPISISEAKKVSSGQEVVVQGKIMGSMQPFVDSRAAFLIGDPKVIISCEVMADDDHCSTPWDACCEDKKKILGNTLSVQVVDANGRILKGGMKGQRGLKELAHVIVKGHVAPSSSPEATVVNADSIQVLGIFPKGKELNY